MKKIHLLLVCITLVIASCQKENSDLSISSSKPVAIIEGEEINPLRNVVVDKNAQKVVSYTDWQRVSRDDMNKMVGGSDYNWYASRFAEKIGSGSQRPVNVCVNGERLIGRDDSQNPCTMWSWWCDRRFVVNDAIFGAQGAKVSRQVPGTKSIRQDNLLNHNVEVPVQVIFSNAVTEEHNWHVSASAGITVTGDAHLPFGIAGGSISVSLSAEAGYGQSHSVTTTENYPTDFFTLKPGQYVIYQLWEYYYPKTVTYPVPLQLQGGVGADYGSGRWNGHYYWYLDANAFWPEYANGTAKYNAILNQKLNHVVHCRGFIYNR